MSVSKYYKTRNKVMLGILSGAHVAVWILGIAALTLGLLMNNISFLTTLGIIFAVRWVVQWFLLALINHKLDKTIEWFSWLFMDFALFMYYVIFGFLAITKRKPRTTWN